MVLKPVPSLQSLCLSSTRDLVHWFSSLVANTAIKVYHPEEEEEDVHPDDDVLPGQTGCAARETVSHHAYGQARDMFLTEMVSGFKRYVLDRVVWYLYEEVSQAVLDGLDRATRDRKSRWNRTTDIRGFTHQLYGIVQFAEVGQASPLRPRE